ncbi:response regulator [Candidatus Fermentibacteria bacterium]|nr:response regulator [Candidatus Fermentibacteria bacterium]
MPADRILVVDDDPHILRLLSSVLEREHFEVVTAEDGEKGWYAVQGEHPDAVITDVMMPRLDGFELVRRLRSDPVVGHTPLMILSGKAEEEDQIKGLELGADDYLVKPFNVELFLARVRALLRRRAQFRAMTQPSTEGPFYASALERLSRYSFGTFVVGKGNSRAVEAAKAVADNLGRRHNPLFLYGGPGRGKTHLMCALANELYSRNSQTRILYLTSEVFSQQIIDAYEHRTVERLRAGYMECDALFIDDIQFLAVSSSLQTVAAGVFSEMYRQQKQIVISGDRRPEEVSTLINEITTGLAAGLVMSVDAPDAALRATILKTKALQSGWPIAFDLLDYLAAALDSDVRTLEGAVKKLVAMHTLGSISLDRAVVDKVIMAIRDDAVPGEPPRRTLEPPAPPGELHDFVKVFIKSGDLASTWGTPEEIAAIVPSPKTAPIIVLGTSPAQVIDTMDAIAGIRGQVSAIPEGERWACLLHPEAPEPEWIIVGTNRWNIGDDLSWAVAGSQVPLYLLVFDSAGSRIIDARLLVASVPRGVAVAVVVLFAGAEHRADSSAKCLLANSMRRLFRVPGEVPVIVGSDVTPSNARTWLRYALEGDPESPGS